MLLTSRLKNLIEENFDEKQDNILTIDYAYDRLSVDEGDIFDMDINGITHRFKCVHHSYMYSTQWVPGGQVKLKKVN